MKGLKHISVLLLVTMFILIGHNLVPHHHHIAFVDHHDEDSGSNRCHAFNGINFVKYNHVQVLRPVRLSSFVIIEDPGIVPDPVTGFATASRLPIHPPIYSSELTGKHSLRGPPEHS